jgi:1-deoxy-D-xylulose-5-phosphate synthase
MEAHNKPGHLKSSLGVVELTLVLHHHFNTPEDVLIWDVGHQAYAHKVLTDRAEEMRHMRQRKGISGFPNRTESVFDAFGTGHSSTALSALAGMVAADQLQGISRQYVAVVGDGALTAGQAYEALNHLGETGWPVWLILNDNDRSIDRNVGALQDGGRYRTFFESLGWQYRHEPAGNDTEALLRALHQMANLPQGPKVLHINTEYALGYQTPTAAAAPAEPGWQEYLATGLMALAERDPRLVVVTPAMTSGAGLQGFKQRFPDRLFDVGIAEQHAVTFAAGLAAAGMRPVCHLYSTFAQRALDQIIHDVALQNLPVVFVIDRSGLVGEDGPTHHGVFDVALLRAIPGMTLTAPQDGGDLVGQLEAALQGTGPWAIRIPKGGDAGSPPALKRAPFALDRTLEMPKHSQATVVFGALHREVPQLVVGDVIALPAVKPLPEQLLRGVFEQYAEVVLLDDSTHASGWSAQVVALAARCGFSGHLRVIALPDEFVPHGTRAELYREFLVQRS